MVAGMAAVTIDCEMVCSHPDSQETEKVWAIWLSIFLLRKTQTTNFLVCACAQRPKADVRVFCSCSLNILRQFLLNPDLADSTRSTGRQAPRIFLFLSPHCCDYSCAPLHPASLHGAWRSNSGFYVCVASTL